MKKELKTRPGITIYPSTIKRGKKAAARLGLSFSAYLELLINQSK